MMVKAFLTIFLALSLVAQGGLVCIQVDNDHILTALVNTGRVVHAANNDFDDEQRGAKAYAVAPLNLPFALKAPANPARPDTHATFFPLHRPLFKLKTAFLI
jgi:hypothetical protein